MKKKRFSAAAALFLLPVMLLSFFVFPVSAKAESAGSNSVVFQFLKKDESGEPLPGATFVLNFKTADGTTVTTVSGTGTSDKDGLVSITVTGSARTYEDAAAFGLMPANVVAEMAADSAEKLVYIADRSFGDDYDSFDATNIVLHDYDADNNTGRLTLTCMDENQEYVYDGSDWMAIGHCDPDLSEGYLTTDPARLYAGKSSEETVYTYTDDSGNDYVIRQDDEGNLTGTADGSYYINGRENFTTVDVDYKWDAENGLWYTEDLAVFCSTATVTIIETVTPAGYETLPETDPEFTYTETTDGKLVFKGSEVINYPAGLPTPDSPKNTMNITVGFYKRSEDAYPLQGAVLCLTDADGNSYSGTTDENGLVTMKITLTGDDLEDVMNYDVPSAVKPAADILRDYYSGAAYIEELAFRTRAGSRDRYLELKDTENNVVYKILEEYSSVSETVTAASATLSDGTTCYYDTTAGKWYYQDADLYVDTLTLSETTAPDRFEKITPFKPTFTALTATDSFAATLASKTGWTSAEEMLADASAYTTSAVIDEMTLPEIDTPEGGVMVVGFYKVDGAGKPLSGATMALTTAGGKTFSAVSDSDGLVRMKIEYTAADAENTDVPSTLMTLAEVFAARGDAGTLTILDLRYRQVDSSTEDLYVEVKDSAGNIYKLREIDDISDPANPVETVTAATATVPGDSTTYYYDTATGAWYSVDPAAYLKGMTLSETAAPSGYTAITAFKPTFTELTASDALTAVLADDYGYAGAEAMLDEASAYTTANIKDTPTPTPTPTPSPSASPSSSGSTVKTGDESSAALWFTLLVFGAITLAGSAALLKKKN